ncbi:hypothetical protein OIU84_030291 [Salix udensis]|uniref:Uncharacterized protein n=1 Tax=Salix udensis TaxID=889485 RepID=A0AAD6KCS8_9ROSI|nr:hypothetical protein OIU84_030291 [Salix udensis]
MGSVVSQAANGIGGVVGNALCSSHQDSIRRFMRGCLFRTMGLNLFHRTLMRLRSVETADDICPLLPDFDVLLPPVQDITCFLWHKLKNTKRVNRRRRFRDIEAGYTSSSESDSSEDYHHLGRKNKSGMERRRRTRSRSWRSLHPSSRFGSRNNHHRHHVRLKTREISVHVKGGSRRPRNSRQLQLRLRNPRRNMGMFKRKRLG